MPFIVESSSINIVHLSDLHLRESTTNETSNILRSLVADVSNRIKSEKLDNVYVVISGDLTFSGKENEFKLVKDFSKSLAESFEFRSIIFSPGNHDLDWNSHPDYNMDLMEDLINNGQVGVERAESRFRRDNDRLALRVGMSNYYNFLRSIGQKYSDHLYSVITTEIEKFKVNFLSLNSAYLFSRKYPYYGYIGSPQIEMATNEADEIGTLDENYRIFNISIFHHPFEAIVPVSQEITQTLLKSRSDIILTGHVHSLRAYVDITASLIGARNTRGHPLISGARCIYDEVRDPHIVPGYAIIGIPMEHNVVKPIRLYEILYDKSRMLWYRDPNNPSFPFLVDTITSSYKQPESVLSTLKVGGITEIINWGWDGKTLLEELIRIDYETIQNLQETDEGTVDTWKVIRMEHPDTWRVLYTEPRKIAGYWSYVALFDEYYNKLLKGEMTEGDISEDKVPVMELPGHYNMFITVMALREKFRGTSAIHLLYSSLLDILENLAMQGIFFDTVLTNAYTPAGESVCKSFGMQYVRASPSHGKLYFLKLYPLPIHNIFKEHPKLTELYHREFHREKEK